LIPLLNSPSIAEIQWDAFSEDCLTPNATGIAQFWRLTDSNFFVLLDDLLSFCLAQKESKQRKKAPYITVDGKKAPSMPSALHK